MRRQEQGISMVGFLLTGAVLAAVLVGGIYAVRHVSIFQNTNTTNRTDGTRTNTSEKPANESAPKTTDSSSSDDTARTTPDTPASSDTQTNNAPAPSQPTTQAPGASNTADLPQTGPLDTFMPLLGVALLTAATSAYVLSRREVA